MIEIILEIKNKFWWKWIVAVIWDWLLYEDLITSSFDLNDCFLTAKQSWKRKHFVSFIYLFLIFLIMFLKKH